MTVYSILGLKKQVLAGKRRFFYHPAASAIKWPFVRSRDSFNVLQILIKALPVLPINPNLLYLTYCTSACQHFFSQHVPCLS